MKRFIILLFCAVSLNAAAQFAWEGTITLDSASADTSIYWANSFRDKPFSLDIDYTDIDSIFRFAIVISNYDNGSFSYYSFSDVTFPVTYNPALVYHDPAHNPHATDLYKGSGITYKRFGIMLIKQGYRSGSIKYRLKQ